MLERIQDIPFYTNCDWAYAMCGIVSIASNVLPYAEEIEHEKNGWLTTNTTADWLQAMEHVSSKASLRRRMLAKAIYHVQRYKNPYSQRYEDLIFSGDEKENKREAVVPK